MPAGDNRTEWSSEGPLRGLVASGQIPPLRQFLSGSGPQIARTARRIVGLQAAVPPKPETPVWATDLVATYVTAREYLHANDTEYSPQKLLSALLAQHSRDEYVHALALMNHTLIRPELLKQLTADYLAALNPAVSGRLRESLTQRPGGATRHLLSRQVILRTLRLVITNGITRSPTASELTHGEQESHIPLLVAAVMLVHIVADGMGTQRTGAPEPKLGGLPESLAMELICNGIFHHSENDGSLFVRFRTLWMTHGNTCGRTRLRKTPLELLEELLKLSISEVLAITFALYALTVEREAAYDDPLIDLHSRVAVDPTKVERYLELFASPSIDVLATETSTALRDWQMLALQDRPLLRVGSAVLVLDVPYLLQRVTTGLYWLVHDSEKSKSDKHRQQWTQAYAEMVERLALDYIRPLSPPILGGGRAFHSEAEIKSAYNRKQCDGATDYGPEWILWEIVSAQPSVPTREEGSAEHFRRDVDRMVVQKARQLSFVASALLREKPEQRRLTVATPTRIIPVAVQGGQFPVNPVSSSYLSEVLASEGLFSEPQITALRIVDLGDLELLGSLRESLGASPADILQRWASSKDSSLSLRWFVRHELGYPPLNRPKAVKAQLRDWFKETARILGTDHDPSLFGTDDE